MSTEAQIFIDQVKAEVSPTLAHWIEAQLSAENRTLEDVKEQIRRVMGILQPPATGGSPEEGPVVVILTEVRVDWDKILNAFIGVCETAACTYWMSSFLPTDNKESQNGVIVARENGDPWYGSLDFWGKEGSATLTYDNPEGDGQVSKTISEMEIVSGLNAMANKCPRHFADLIADNDDAITHDVLIQCIIFGEIIYG